MWTRNLTVSLVFLVAASAGTCGCGPIFSSDQEELAYLQRISNPTPQQFRRQQELEHKATGARERIAKAAEVARQAEADQLKAARATEDRQKLDSRITERDRRERGETPETAKRLAFLRSEAQRTEGRGAYSVAVIWLNDLLEEFPKVPDRLEIEQRIKTLQSKPDSAAERD